MKVKVQKKEFKKLIDYVSQITGSPLPILNMIKLEFKESSLSATASDLEVYLSGKIPTIGDVEEKVICVDTKKLRGIADALPDGDVNIEILTVKMKISGGKSKYSVSCIGDEDFPTPEPVGEDAIEGKVTDEIINAIVKVYSCATTDEFKGAMTGVWVTENHIAATDGFRAAVAYEPCGIKDLDIVLPGKTVRLISLLKRARSPLEIAGELTEEEIPSPRLTTLIASDSKFKIIIDNFGLEGKLVDQKFPNIFSVIPKDQPSKVMVKKSEFLSALKSVRVNLGKFHPIVSCEILENSIIVRTKDEEVGGTAEIEIDAKEGTPINCGFNAEFLNDMLSILEKEDITITYSKPQRAFMVIEDKLTQIIMPTSVLS